MKFGLSFCLFFVFTSCSLMNSIALKTTANVIRDGSDELYYESSWEHFKASTPGNLKLLEGLWFSDQKNKILLALLTKGYAGYAFGVSETLALPDMLKEVEDSSSVEQAILMYQKAIYYGERYLELVGISQDKLWNKNFPERAQKLLEKEIKADDYVTLFYFAQALGGAINLQRESMYMMSKMNHAIKIVDWVCDKSPTLELGSCQLYQAVLSSSIPSIMGGSQEKAKKIFIKMINDNPYHLLARVSYIQYHIVPMMNEDEFDMQMKLVGNEIALWYSNQLGDNKPAAKKYKKHSKFNLFNSIAKKKYEMIKSLKLEIL